MQVGLLEPNRFDSAAIARLNALGHMVTEFDGVDLQDFLKYTQVLFVRLAYQIDAAFLAQAPNLRYVCSPTTGHAHLDEDVLASRGIKLISLRGERVFLDSIRATPEHTFGLVLALLRNYHRALLHVAAGGWDRDLFRGEELYGQKVGIVGLGRVGFRVASYCEAFGAHISYVDTDSVKANNRWHRLHDISQLIQSTRIIIFCASYINGAAPILGQSDISLLQGHYLINTARGELIDEAALLNAIEANKLKGVAIDVISHETGENRLEKWNIVAKNHNVFITPHIGGATFSAMARTEKFIVEKLVTALQGMEKIT